MRKIVKEKDIPRESIINRIFAFIAAILLIWIYNYYPLFVLFIVLYSIGYSSLNSMTIFDYFDYKIESNDNKILLQKIEELELKISQQDDTIDKMRKWSIQTEKRFADNQDDLMFFKEKLKEILDALRDSNKKD